MRPTILAVAIAAAAPAAPAVTTADYEFRYGWPAAADAIPALRRWFVADRRAARARVAAESATDRREARGSGYPFRPHDDQTAWKVVTATPRFLSLSGTHYAYTGGAHGGTGSRAMLWDKAARRRLAPLDLFVSPAALARAAGPAFCTQLNVERARRRGAPVRAPGDPFSDCPKLADLTLLLGSTDRRAIDRIGLVADQYVAGPYVEGAYEVTLPVTPAVLAAVKPAYRAAFRAH